MAFLKLTKVCDIPSNIHLIFSQSHTWDSKDTNSLLVQLNRSGSDHSSVLEQFLLASPKCNNIHLKIISNKNRLPESHAGKRNRESNEQVSIMIKTWWVGVLTHSPIRTVLDRCHMATLSECNGLPPHDLVKLTGTHTVGDWKRKQYQYEWICILWHLLSALILTFTPISIVFTSDMHIK